MSDGEITIIPFHPLLVERRRVATDLANVEGAMRDLQLLVARHGNTRNHAELICAQCADELVERGLVPCHQLRADVSRSAFHVR